MKPLAVGTWMLGGGPPERLEWCARAGFRWIELRDEEGASWPSRAELEARGLAVLACEADPARPCDPRVLERAAALGAAHFVHAPRAARSAAAFDAELQLAASHGLRSLLHADDPAAHAHPGLGLLWDPWRAERAGLDAAAHATRLAQVRWSDGTRERRLALGAGTIDLVGHFTALREPLLQLPCWGLDFEGCAEPAREARKATGFLRELTRASRR